MIQLSLIIPMYNVEPYVERCIRSLENQDIPKEDYELICINDGSPDNCKSVVESLMKEFQNIILIDQENQGVSRARNNGIKQAKGQYILFIDPDDYIDKNSLSSVLKKAREKNVDVSFLGFTFLNLDGSVRKQILNENHATQIYPGPTAYHLARGDGQTDPDRMVAVLFKRELFQTHNLFYLPDVAYLEDGEFIARILCLAEKCIFDGNSFYQRTTRPGSATNSKLFQSTKAINGFILAAHNLKKFQIARELTDKQKNFLNQPIAKFVLLVVYASFMQNRFKSLKPSLNQLKELKLRRVKTRGCNLQYTIYGKSYNFHPVLAIGLIFLFPKIQVFFSRRKKINTQ